MVNSYTYDAVGNRESATENGVTTTYLYDSNDRMLSSTQSGVLTTYGYDDNGSMLSKASNGDDTTFAYDARNKLISAIQNQGGSAISNVTFEYDIDGNRTQKTDNGNITNFVVDRNQRYAQVVHETDDQNATQVTYTHGDDLISQDRSASVNYYNYDGLGSTRSLTDSAGVITDTVDYNAYGSILHQTGTTTNRYLYTGEQFDAALDNYYLRARYYDPTVGRFTQMDTFAGFEKDPITLHKYLYGNANPINGIDPSGKFTLMDLNFSQQQNVLRSISTINLRNFLKHTVTVTIQSARLALNEVKRCVKSKGKRCNLSIPVLVVGSETKKTSEHILDAMTGGEKNIVNSPFFLTRKSPPHSRSWIRSNRACKNKVGGTTRNSCDEYPFASTNQGEKTNSKQVSLRPVPVDEQFRQGGILSAFYSACRIKPVGTKSSSIRSKGSFIVIPTPESMGFPLCLR